MTNIQRLYELNFKLNLFILFREHAWINGPCSQTFLHSVISLVTATELLLVPDFGSFHFFFFLHFLFHFWRVIHTFISHKGLQGHVAVVAPQAKCAAWHLVRCSVSPPGQPLSESGSKWRDFTVMMSDFKKLHAGGGPDICSLHTHCTRPAEWLMAEPALTVIRKVKWLQLLPSVPVPDI